MRARLFNRGLAPGKWVAGATLLFVTSTSVLLTFNYVSDRSRDGQVRPKSRLARVVVGRELRWVRRVLTGAGVEVDVALRRVRPGANPWDTVAGVSREDLDAYGRVLRVALEVERSDAPPVSLSRLRAGQRCVPSAAQRVEEQFEPLIGTGAVRLGGAGKRGVLRVDPAAGPLKEFVYFVGLPPYSGPLLVRGARIDGPGAIGFQQQSVPAGPNGSRMVGEPGEMHFPQDEGLRTWGATLIFDGFGCHALQIDGDRFQEEIVFDVRPARRALIH